MSQVAQYLQKDGICKLPDLYTLEDVAKINQSVDPLLSSRADQHRAYVYPDELLDLGIFWTIFNERVRAALCAIMPDPVLYHCHIYEIAANDARPHIFGETLSGWHRDSDSGYSTTEPTHVSMFLYLTDVGEDDGAFEFVPGVPPAKWLQSKAPYNAQLGSRGTCFAWQRSYYHRASPNRGPTRRRLFKLSIQRNAFPSSHLANEHFSKLIPLIPSDNLVMNCLLGRYQGKDAPALPNTGDPRVEPVVPQEILQVPSAALAKIQLRQKAHGFIQKIKRVSDVAAYD